ncbi:uncharacterized protein LOC124881082 isoform X2 [Girardinichthys multiradiatus]|uniref:uncharacterized protein LOC124881082 isoform X2 n=1 Tax=Girardinichthys multiradiatus TaxID=208333 RepID=UPI001FAC2481|nr:uncharacterized protein LOC124881082 isoform X2 [Girardinichthys multiradiatus]
MLFSVVLLLVSVTQASHYRGTLMTYYPKETYANGSVSVILRFKFNFQSCQDGSFSCTGNCVNESLVLPNTKCEEVIGAWCQSEKITSWLLPNNSQFQLVHASNSWIDNRNGAGSWRAVTDVELRHRSDTNRPNSSPQTTMFPALRVPSNCQRNINLLAFDPDGDEVKCRYAKMSLTECYSPCTPPSVLSLSSTCTLSFSANSNSIEGWYVVEMVMEDFPRQAITLTQTNGSKVVKTTSDAISKIPIQFTFLVDPAAPSCSEGVYLPRFLVPTPEHGAHFYSPVNQALKIDITATATQSVITGLLVSGPYNVVKSSSGSGSFSLTWKPSASEDGQSHPICFVVQASLKTQRPMEDWRSGGLVVRARQLCSREATRSWVQCPRLPLWLPEQDP